ncbi:hypothetical protein [Paraflavitalea sp. CAU 1676]|uniref:hypothetical protein n=1 Tax=Paraflavitalea sp. CAU 1676 TaxID=3032598 RepID=UPI0023D99F07|nr:hypothetical protein [Paraflavitalea sp. CAU 1676]MDF2188431.1 hypothetical protein [Paraflavitalea sp. CAU 1676]
MAIFFNQLMLYKTIDISELSLRKQRHQAMNYRLRTHYVFIPIIQIVFFIAAYELTNYMAHKMDLVYSRGVAWGISAADYLIKYALIIIGLTIANLAINRIHLLLSAAAAILFTIFGFPRTIQLSLSGWSGNFNRSIGDFN